MANGEGTYADPGAGGGGWEVEPVAVDTSGIGEGPPGVDWT